MTNREIEKEHELATKNMVKCTCGHSLFIRNKYGREICSWCNNWVYKDKKTEFMYKMKEKLNGKMVYDRKN